MILTKNQKKLLLILPDEDRMRITESHNNEKFYQLINDDDVGKISKVRNKHILDALMERAKEIVDEAYGDYVDG